MKAASSSSATLNSSCQLATSRNLRFLYKLILSRMLTHQAKSWGQFRFNVQCRACTRVQHPTAKSYKILQQHPTTYLFPKSRCAAPQLSWHLVSEERLKHIGQRLQGLKSTTSKPNFVTTSSGLTICDKTEGLCAEKTKRRDTKAYQSALKREKKGDPRLKFFKSCTFDSWRVQIAFTLVVSQ